MVYRNRRKRKERNNKILVIFIAFIMISSVFGVIFYGFNNQNNNKVEDKGITFIDRQGYWYTTIDGTEMIFNNLPSNVEYIELPQELKDRLSNAFQLDITSELEDPLNEYIALVEHEAQLALTAKNIYVRTGFTTPSDYNVPIITCDDATQSVPILYYKESNETKVYMQDNCIIAEAVDGIDILRISDRILYEVLGIL